ncbi:hypothetical protein OHA46_32140 [Streptomyces sp. NBC_00708]
MAIWQRPEPLNPETESAAEAGYVPAMRQLGKYLYESRKPDQAEKWLLAAAEARDAEAMYTLSKLHHDRASRESPDGKAHDLAAASWCRRAAEQGWVPAIWSMRSWADSEEHESWIRKAMETGDPHAPSALAHLLAEEGRTSEAEHWYREESRRPDSIGFHARDYLADFLLRQGRLEEAAQHWRQNAEAGSSAAAHKLAYVLEKLGEIEEADRWRRQADLLRVREREEDEPER